MDAPPLRRPRRPLGALLALLAAQGLGCASGIGNLYEEERAAALATADAPRDWQPDLRLRLSQGALDGLVEATLDAGLLAWDEQVELKLPLGLTARVDPQAQVQELSLAASSACEGCMAMEARLQGQARWSAGGSSGRVPFTARVGGTVAFEVERADEGWALRGRVRELDRVELGSAEVGAVDATPLLGGWLRDALEQVKPIALGTLGGADLPLAAARLSTGDGQLEVQLLSDLVERVPLPAGAPSRDPWELRVSTQTLLGLARREAFALGPIAYDTAAVPTSLAMSGRGFTLGVRLWNLDGRGWWRDYTVEGQLSVGERRLELEPTSATEGEKSQGAGLADPLALLAEGRILDAVEQGVRQTLPGGTAMNVGNKRIRAQVQRASGSPTELVLRGTLEEVSGGAVPR